MNSNRQNPTRPSNTRLPWLLTAVLFLLLLLLIGTGYWRAAGVGPQVQVPMFYDDHYLYPRPWTQTQEAPGVPDPAPVSALYGPNRVSQPFVSRSDNLSMITVWLAGPPQTAVAATLTTANGPTYGGQIVLDAANGRFYHLTFPTVRQANGRTFWLTLAAPDAAAGDPVTTRTVGGDRLGSAVRLNEYPRPGNLELYTYARGLPGRWWLHALAEQLVPDLFLLRVQQYKPFKSPAFPLLLGLTVALTAVFLILSWPTRRAALPVTGWLLAALLTTFMLWQIGTGRMRLPPATTTTPLAATDAPLAAGLPADTWRVVIDVPAVLWTTERQPEERFIATDLVNGRGAVRVPAQARVGVSQTLPPAARFVTTPQVDGPGTLRFSVRWNDETIAQETVTNGEEPPLTVDLSPWAGQSGTLHLATEPVDGQPDGLWLAPQIQSHSPWLHTSLPAAAQPTDVRFGDQVQLVGYTVMPQQTAPGETTAVTLYWRTVQRLDAYATAFVHVLDEQNNIVAQHDAQPVQNAYPLPVWPPNTLVADTHTLALPPDLPTGTYRIAAGLYDPDSFVRWPAFAADGTPLPDNRVLLQTTLTVEYREP